MGSTYGIQVVKPFLFVLNFEAIQGTGGGGGVVAVQNVNSSFIINTGPVLL